MQINSLGRTACAVEDVVFNEEVEVYAHDVGTFVPTAARKLTEDSYRKLF